MGSRGHEEGVAPHSRRSCCTAGRVAKDQEIFEAMDANLQPEAVKGDGSLEDAFAPQFVQHAASGGDCSAGTTYGLIDVRLCLEGEEVIVAVPMAELEGIV